MMEMSFRKPEMRVREREKTAAAEEWKEREREVEKRLEEDRKEEDEVREKRIPTAEYH